MAFDAAELGELAGAVLGGYFTHVVKAKWFTDFVTDMEHIFKKVEVPVEKLDPDVSQQLIQLLTDVSAKLGKGPS
jgi:hypothetical protein